VRRKNPDWKRYVGIVVGTRRAAQKLFRGLTVWPGEWQRLPDYVRPALKAIEAAQSWRLAEPVRPNIHRWFARLVMWIPPDMTVDPRDYAKCFVLSRGVFTDASFEAAKRKFEAFPSPAQLLKFLIDWGEEHRPSNLPDKDRRHRRLILTGADRQRLLNAEAGKGLTQCHVRIAHTLASWPHAYGQPSHQHLACATGTSCRTVRRALSALCAVGLLPEGRGLPVKMPKQVPGLEPALAATAARAGCSVKTLYRWQREASLEKPHQEE
jgi:hypothetical protein